MPGLLASGQTCLTSRMEMGRSETSNSPQLRVSSRMESRVTPGRIVPSRGAVASSCPRPPACECRGDGLNA